MSPRFFLPVLGLCLLTLTAGMAPVTAAETTLTWHGHAAFEIVTPNGKVIMIDPWLKNPLNPSAKDGKDPVAAVAKLDYILLTHGHLDHVGDTVALAKRTKARLIANFELGTNLAKLHGFPKEQMGRDSLINIGGEIQIADGEVTVTMVPAVHSSGLVDPYAGEKDPDVVFGGHPGGFVIRIKNGPTLYHTGDTAFFKDMALIGELYPPDVALINIGGHFGMEPPLAARAAKTVRARLAIPHHYGTWPELTPDPSRFVDELARKGVNHRVLQPGSSMTFKGNRPAQN